jgi:hypothetical protein
VKVKGKKIRPRGHLKYVWNHPDLSQTTKEKIAYHNGKEYFRLDRAGSAHAARKANGDNENYSLSCPRVAVRLGNQILSEPLRRCLQFEEMVKIAAFDGAASSCAGSCR